MTDNAVTDDGMYTVNCAYFATGEGTSYMVLITRGYGPNNDPRDNAMHRFTELFGSWYAKGATVANGMNFDFPGSKLLIADETKAKLLDWVQDAGGLEYHASIHVNFS